MKFGIFYEHQLPRPWTEDAEHNLLKNSLLQIELADKLGHGERTVKSWYYGEVEPSMEQCNDLFEYFPGLREEVYRGNEAPRDPVTVIEQACREMRESER